MRPGVQETTWRGNVQGNHSPAPLKEWYATLAQMTGLHHWKGINVCCRKPLSFWWFVTAAWDTLRHVFCQSMEHLKCESEVTQSCPTLGDPMSCSLPGSSVHGIFQATVLEWVFLLQGLLPTQGSNPGLPHCRSTLYRLSHQGSPYGTFRK